MSILLPSQRTKFTANEKDAKNWILIDAKGEVLGRLAGRIAYRLRGKHRPDYAPHQNLGDYIVVINAKDIVVTGKKGEQKVYRKHSHYPGGLRTTVYNDMMEKDPTFALKKAVQRMLPSGPLGRKLLGNLRVYADENHQHKSQKPVVWDVKYK